MTDAVVRVVVVGTARSVRVSDGSSFLGLPFTPHESLRVLSCPLKTFKLEVELFLRFESKYVVDFTEGLGLGTV